jgi:hypothetical protein
MAKSSGKGHALQNWVHLVRTFFKRGSTLREDSMHRRKRKLRDPTVGEWHPSKNYCWKSCMWLWSQGSSRRSMAPQAESRWLAISHRSLAGTIPYLKKLGKSNHTPMIRVAVKGQVFGGIQVSRDGSDAASIGDDSYLQYDSGCVDFLLDAKLLRCGRQAV